MMSYFIVVYRAFERFCHYEDNFFGGYFPRISFNVCWNIFIYLVTLCVCLFVAVCGCVSMSDCECFRGYIFVCAWVYILGKSKPRANKPTTHTPVRYTHTSTPKQRDTQTYKQSYSDTHKHTDTHTHTRVSAPGTNKQ